jgi:hypothetical protein
MPNTDNFILSEIKGGLRHPMSVYNYVRELKRLRENKKHPFVNSTKIKSVEKHYDFLKYLFDTDFNEQYIYSEKLHYLYDLYNENNKKIVNLYGPNLPTRALSEEESISLYFSVSFLKPEVVVETGVSHGMSSLFILSALAENQKGHLYSVDFPDIGMPHLYGKEPGWIVDDALRTRWTLIYGKSKLKLPSLLEKLNYIDLFIHDSEHSYFNMKFEFSNALAHMKNGSLLLSDDIKSNSALQEVLNEFGFNCKNICLLTGKNSDFGGTLISKCNMKDSTRS